MKRAILTAAIVAVFALPAAAEQAITIQHTIGGPQITSRQTSENNPVRTDIVGSFLWAQWDNGDIYSVDVSDPSIVGAVLHNDGTVTLQHAAISTPEPVEETVTLVVRLPEFEVQ